MNSPETELIFVDDGSGDGTTTLLEDWVGKMGERCSLKKLSKNIGKGFAVRAGLKLACGDYVAYTDADLPYGLDILAQMLGVLQKKSDIFLLYGSRVHPLSTVEVNYNWLRKVGHLFFSYLVRNLLFQGVEDTQCGVKMMRSELKDLMIKKSTIDHFAFDMELFVIALQNKLLIQAFPVVFNHQKKSSVRIIKDTLLMIRDILKIKTRNYRS